VSRSTDASPGTPDDGEGPLDDAVTGNGDADADATDDVRSDEVEPDDAEADEPDAVGTNGSDEDAEEKADAPVSAVAGRGARGKREPGKREPAVARRSASSRAVARKPAAPTTGATTSRNPIAALVLFVRQVIAELRKVVTPTSKELGTYVAVVIVFVIVVMAYVGVLDYAVGRLVLWAFGG
jgi:preprotein translocase subunit SecE